MSLLNLHRDASVIPIIPAGVHSTVVMVATTASQLILIEAGLE